MTAADPNAIVTDAIAIVVDALAGKYGAALADAAKLALQGVLAVPPLEAPSLDPNNRAAVDAEVDAEVLKT